MTKEYDTELVKQRCQELQKSASDLCEHDIPDWLRQRLTHIIDEARALDSVLSDETSSGHGRD